MDIVKLSKAELQASVDDHKEAINKDLIQITNGVEKMLGDTLLTIGVLLSSLALYKLLKKTDKVRAPKDSNRILKVLKQQLAVYILNEGRSKIIDYINSLDEK